jgi:hypothetical protein
MTTPPDPSFHLVYFPVMLEQVKQLRQIALDRGRADEFRTSLGVIVARLTADPQSWGEPLYPLRHLGLVVYHKVSRGLLVRSAVDEVRRIVYLREIVPLSGSPLAAD